MARSRQYQLQFSSKRLTKSTQPMRVYLSLELRMQLFDEKCPNHVRILRTDQFENLSKDRQKQEEQKVVV